MKKKVQKVKVPELPNGLSIGDLVLYYDLGWRAGYLIETRKSGTEVGIKAVGGYKKSVHNLTWKKISDIKPVETKGKDEVSQKCFKLKRKKIYSPSGSRTFKGKQ